MLNERAIIVKDKIKNHIKRNQTKYYVCGLVGVAGVTFVVTRRVMLRKFMQLEGTNLLINKAIVKGNGAFYNVFNIYPQGFRNQGPSWMVKCLETGAVFPSQEHAARTMGLSKEQLSAHLNTNRNGRRGRSNVGGYHFERIGIAA